MKVKLAYGKNGLIVDLPANNVDVIEPSFVEGLKELGKEVDLISVGSSLKLCFVAEGSANVYPRFGPTMEWDTGAAHAVVLESGRKVISHETGQSLIYNKPSLMNPWFIVE